MGPADVAAALLALTSLLLLAFGLNLLYLSFRALRLPPPTEPSPLTAREPLVCVQLPIYNERHVARRAIEAAAALDWPRDNLEIQVLDDSDDETAALAGAVVARLRRSGTRIEHVRRRDRSGYKAGALAHGMTLTAAPFLAVFDADFVPPGDFLRRSLGAFADPSIGFVQARWGHLNEAYSWLTRLQALAVDFHFLVEQPVRSRSWFTNFTGTAGVWRRRAIEEAGGWSSATLTEDLDLSYRAQLAGWRPAYLETLVVPEELPVDVAAYRRQQARWATGSFQTAYRLLPAVLRSKLPAGLRWQAAVHLLSYAVGPLMLLQLACYPFLVAATARHQPIPGLGAAGLVINAVSVAPWAGFVVAQVRRGRPWWHGAPALLCQVLGAGLSLTVLLALIRSLRTGGEFVRTPKYRIERSGEEWRDSEYVRAWSPASLLELGVGALALAVSLQGARLGLWLVALYAGVFATGLLGLGLLSAVEALQVLTLRKLGRRAGQAAGGALRLGAMLLLPALLLTGVALGGQPFEDSYQHWLMAANLAETGHLHDPLFAMEDSWLPGYQVMAAALLELFGLHRLDVLVAAGVGLGLVSLALLSSLAGGGRRAFLAVSLLALNPAFLLTSVSTVAEPLTVALLLGAAASARSRRWPLAAGLAALAALTGTKAWLWLLGLAVPALLAALAPARRRPLAWLAPALAVLVLLQLGFAPAGHSAARAAVEVQSASLRGSLAPGAAGRLAAFGGWFLLASAPIAVLAPFGLLAELRTEAGRERLRLFHLPSLLYLAAVMVLVAAGFYSGSHRYYLPALPSLALLAAAALEGRRLAAPLATAAAALLAVAYVPVFSSFSAGNAGVAAAGRAASRVDGRLLTDSPAAAFYSGKPPSEIAGSSALPAARADAIAWLRRGGYTSLVLEGIDYYPATRVFPELASGRPEEPFQALGVESSYQVPGGKPAFAYSLDAESFDAPLAAGILACVHPDLQPAAGKTAPLAKGVVLERGSELAGEGVGFGVPIAHFPDGWYFPGDGQVEDVSDLGRVAWRKRFQLDLREVDTASGSFAGFERTASRGTVEVTYRLDGPRIEVQVSPVSLQPGADQVVLLNEESAAFDDFAEPGRTLLGSDFGSWVEARGPWARLRSASAGVEWSQPALPGAALRAAREVRSPDLDFAGLEYVFAGPFEGADYTITVGRAR